MAFESKFSRRHVSINYQIKICRKWRVGKISTIFDGNDRIIKFRGLD